MIHLVSSLRHLKIYTNIYVWLYPGVECKAHVCLKLKDQMSKKFDHCVRRHGPAILPDLDDSWRKTLEKP